MYCPENGRPQAIGRPRTSGSSLISGRASLEEEQRSDRLSHVEDLGGAPDCGKGQPSTLNVAPSRLLKIVSPHAAEPRTAASEDWRLSLSLARVDRQWAARGTDQKRVRQLERLSRAALATTGSGAVTLPNGGMGAVGAGARQEARDRVTQRATS